MSEVKEKNEFIEKLKILNKAKDTIINEIRGIKSQGVSKTQAQNLREYAVQTSSIEEVLLYIDYQCARERTLKDPGQELRKLMEKYKDQGIEVIRYMLGIFARHVMIQSKERGE
jgi:hypothetical protein